MKITREIQNESVVLFKVFALLFNAPHEKIEGKENVSHLPLRS